MIKDPIEDLNDTITEIIEKEDKLLQQSDGLTVNFILGDNAKAPSKAHDSDAGFDLSATWFEQKDFSILAHTGVQIELPEGYEAQIRPRSGLAVKGVTVVNSPGTIDAGYRGEICVILGSTTGQPPFFPNGGKKFVKVGNAELNSGDRVAQMVIQPVLRVKMNQVTTFEESTERGEGGFGSTGA